MTEMRACKKCDTEYLLNKDNFGHTPSGNFRWVCRACIRSNVKKHSKENGSMVSARGIKRKTIIAHSKNHKDYDSGKIRRTLYEKQQGVCYYCKQTISPIHADLEHMTPVSRGGLDQTTNIVLSCYTCNKEKHSKTVDEYRSWKEKNGYKILF